ncbi:MAG: PAS domain S-box protein [Oscillatoria princeps RMCB-10]|nr:PAS domain S-box protein [Oscillatoria princeps RMCB-10]
MKFYRRCWPYGVAIGSTAMALQLTLWLKPLLSQIVSPLFYIAIIVSAWYGGFRPGMVAVVLSTLAISYFFLTPLNQFGIAQPEDLLQLGFFLLVALAIDLLTDNFQESKKKVERLSQQLAQENAEQLRMALSALRESQIQLQRQLAEIENIYQSAPIGLNVLDADLRFVRINQRLAEINGFSVEAHIGRTVRELLPELADTAENLLHSILETGNPLLNVEITGETPAHPGVQRTWVESFLPLKNGDKIIGISTVCEEITERKQAQLALQQLNAELEDRVRARTAELTEVNERLLVALLQKEHAYQLLKEQAQLLELAHDSIITWDLNSAITFWNQGAESMYGWSKAEALGQDLHALLKTQFPKPHAEIQAELLEKGYWEGEIIHFTWDDHQVPVASRWVVQKDDAGRPIKILEINNDITERKQAELALQHHIREVEDLYNNAPCGYHSLDEEGTIVRINDTELNWLGMSRNEVLYKKKFVELITPDCQDIFKQNFPQFLQQGWLGNQEFQILCKDGSIRCLNVNATAIRDEAGNFLMSRTTLFDISERKRAEAAQKEAELALRESEEQRRLALDLTNTGFWDLDLPTGNLVWNDNHFTLLGLVPGAIAPSYKLWIERLHPQDRDRVEQLFAYSLEARIDYEAEYRVVHPDGSVHWLMGRAKGVYDESGQPVRSLGVLLDISDRKRAEEALQQQAKQELLLFSITQAIRQSLELNAILNTAVTEVKQTLQVDRAAVYRFNPDWSGDFVVESVTPDWVKLVTPDVQKVWDDTYLQETGGGRFQNRETFVVADIYTAGLQPCHIELLEQFQAKAYAIAPLFSGEALWGLLAIYQNAARRNWQSWEIELLEQIASQLAIAINQSELYELLQIELHERKQTEATLLESERRWRFLLDNVQLLVVGLDCKGAVNYANPFFLKLTGYAESEALGQNWFETFVPVAHRQQVQRDFSDILASNEHPYYQNFILTKLREERFIAWNNTLLRDSAGSIIGTVCIGEDITVRHKIELMKNEFIGIVSHELRTPLTAIRASLGLLKTGVYDKKPDKFKRMIEIALIDSERLVRLVNDILDLERLESGRAVLEKATCKAADLMQQAVEGVRALADRQHITLSVHPTDVEVWAASDAIVQTLTNLLSNALKFSPSDTAITLSVERQTDQALFHVSDRGRGIPADKLEAIFGRFQQVDASDSRDKGGTGLGLAICRSIIEQHGGLIWVESTLGAGSTFFFTLPLSVEHGNDTICL